MDWLKDKKNLPKVVGLAVFVLLAAVGLIAFETGLFSPRPAAAPAITASGMGQPLMPGSQLSISPGGPSMGRPLEGNRNPIGMQGSQMASALPKTPLAPKLLNPGVGPDPFSIPGGAKNYAKQVNSALLGNGSGMPPLLRDILPRIDLYRIPPPSPPPFVVVPSSDPASQIYKLTGVLNSEGSVLAILETNGQSQTVKPGDSLSDGGKVVSIQDTSVTLRTPGGTTVSIPLSTGAGAPDQYQNGQNEQNGQNGQFGQMQYQQNFPGQQFGQ
jgi:hypothetical protein